MSSDKIKDKYLNKMDSNAGERVKILIIGPAHAGKTAIANFIAERSEVLNPNYHPTAATRIVEFEKLGPKNPRRPGQDQVLVELWDVSGDAKYDRCWPAIQKGTHGIILAYNADNPRQEDEMEVWVRNFPKKMGIPASVCIGFAHHPNGKPIKNKSKPRNTLLVI